ncbi:MAG: glucose-phosphatase [Patescibacteria group bacterium]|nr:glucose-phosphatase [Patescibacteria group bacterium]
MKKTIIFDLNGVFIISPLLSDRFNKDFGVKPDDFMPVLNNIMSRVRRPNSASVYDLWKPHLSKWKINFSEMEFLDYWFNAERENIELVNLAKELKRKGYKLIIMSNNFSERAKYYSENLHFLTTLFESIYYSWETGFIKPDVHAFELIFKNNGLKPEDCLYFDDSEKNIDLAISIGIDSYVFSEDSVEILRSLL